MDLQVLRRASLVAQPPQRDRMIHAVLGHVPIRRPLPAGNRQQSRRVHVNHVVARKRRRLSLPLLFTSGRNPTYTASTSARVGGRLR